MSPIRICLLEQPFCNFFFFFLSLSWPQSLSYWSKNTEGTFLPFFIFFNFFMPKNVVLVNYTSLSSFCLSLDVRGHSPGIRTRNRPSLVSISNPIPLDQ